MAELEQTLDSTEIADMIEKSHSNLIRDIRRYVEQFNEAKIGFVDFFKESTYVDAKGETRPCYRITKKGCEFIAHKLTGTKGTIFTARYINRFHEMQAELSEQRQQAELEELRKTVRSQGKILNRIEHRLSSGSRLIGAGSGTLQDTYREETVRLLYRITLERRLQQIYTIAYRMEKREQEERAEER